MSSKLQDNILNGAKMNDNHFVIYLFLKLNANTMKNTTKQYKQDKANNTVKLSYIINC